MFKIVKSNIEIAYKSAEDCSISLKSGTKFEHVTADTLHQMFKVKGQKSRSQG